jgi:hypothetical protein
MGLEVLRGADIGLPKNKLITIIRFRAIAPSISRMADQWGAVVDALPKKLFPSGIRPICDRAEEFRKEYASSRPCLNEARKIYFEYLKNCTG